MQKYFLLIFGLTILLVIIAISQNPIGLLLLYLLICIFDINFSEDILNSKKKFATIIYIISQISFSIILLVMILIIIYLTSIIDPYGSLTLLISFLTEDLFWSSLFSFSAIFLYYYLTSKNLLESVRNIFKNFSLKYFLIFLLWVIFTEFLRLLFLINNFFVFVFFAFLVIMRLIFFNLSYEIIKS